MLHVFLISLSPLPLPLPLIYLSPSICAAISILVLSETDVQWELHGLHNKLRVNGEIATTKN